MIIGNANVFLDGAFRPACVTIEGDKIAAIGGPDGPFDVDAGGRYLVPGFVDVHTHGAMNEDFSDGKPEGLPKMSRYYAQNGVTSFLATTMTLKEETLTPAMETLRDFVRPADGAKCAGIHLEGPFLSPEYKGAMPEHLLKKNDAPLVRHYQELAQGGIRYMTISPELEGVQDMLPVLKELGIVVGIGHSGATYEQAMSAIAQGAAVGTHVGNAMRLFHQHEPAIFGAVMESDVYCEAICDGRHLAPGTVRMYAKCKGIDRIVAITDSIMATGLPDGEYHLGVNEVVVTDGDATLKSNGTRAGSTLTQDVALKNMVKWLPNPLEEILMTLTENPAKEMGLWDRKGSIDEGKDAGLVLLDAQCNVVHVFARGKQVR